MSCPSSIHCWDLNPRPLECEPPPITTRPGLSPGGLNQFNQCAQVNSEFQHFLTVLNGLFYTVRSKLGPTKSESDWI